MMFLNLDMLGKISPVGTSLIMIQGIVGRLFLVQNFILSIPITLVFNLSAEGNIHNGILQISLNGKDTTSFDPREVVVTFLKRKEHRNSQPDAELFRDRERFSGHLQAACDDSSYH